MAAESCTSSSRWEAAWLLVRLRRCTTATTSREAETRVNGRSCASDWRRWCAQLVRNDSSSDRGRNDGRPSARPNRFGTDRLARSARTVVTPGGYLSAQNIPICRGVRPQAGP